jgi:hypothetical protein
MISLLSLVYLYFGVFPPIFSKSAQKTSRLALNDAASSIANHQHANKTVAKQETAQIWTNIQHRRKRLKKITKVCDMALSKPVPCSAFLFFCLIPSATQPSFETPELWQRTQQIAEICMVVVISLLPCHPPPPLHP